MKYCDYTKQCSNACNFCGQHKRFYKGMIGKLDKSTNLNTVDSRYLEVDGTL